jgi:hypothetical protein
MQVGSYYHVKANLALKYEYDPAAALPQTLP